VNEEPGSHAARFAGGARPLRLVHGVPCGRRQARLPPCIGAGLRAG
jgi:hypothetical protein